MQHRLLFLIVPYQSTHVLSVSYAGSMDHAFPNRRGEAPGKLRNRISLWLLRGCR